MSKVLGFIEFLNEVKRDVPRAEKLLNYIHKRWSNQFGEIRTGNSWSIQPYKNVSDARHDNYPDANSYKKKNLKPNDIVPLQKWVHTDNVKKKLRNPDPKPIETYHFAGKEMAIDGHHRLMAARLRGDDKIAANSTPLRLTKGQKRRKKLTGKIDRPDD